MVEEEADARVLRTGAGAVVVGDSAEARDYLRKQSLLADLEIDKLRKEDEFELSHLRWRRFNDQMRGALQIMAIAVGAVIVIAIGAALWNASQADGLVVDSFSVPPGFAARGIGGDTVASDFTSRLASVRNEAVSNAYSSSSDVSRDRSNDLRVEIPDTGVSLAEVWRALRGWLGHERHLSGSLREAADGTLVLSASADGGQTIVSAGKDLDAVEQSAAEKVFCTYDRTGCANYLIAANRTRELAGMAREAMAAARSKRELGWAYAFNGMVEGSVFENGGKGVALARIGAGYDPSSMRVWIQLIKLDAYMGHAGAVVADAHAILGLKSEDQPKYLQGGGFETIRRFAVAAIGLWTGDYAGTREANCQTGECTTTDDFGYMAYVDALVHDDALARGDLMRAQLLGDANQTLMAQAGATLRAQEGDWAGAAAEARHGIAAASAEPQAWNRFSYRDAVLRLTALLAVAQAHLGDFTGARATLARTRADCYPCLIARGDVDAVRKDWGGADYWYGRAVAAAPDLPLAYARGGAALMEKGDLARAIARFKTAHEKGPHFADPLEMWGEALMAQSRSDLALAKFAEAARTAPHWARLQLKSAQAHKWASHG